MIGGSSSFVSAPSFLNSSEIIFIISSNQHMSDLIHCSESFSPITDAFPNQATTAGFPWSCFVLFCVTIFSTQQGNSRAVLNFGNWNTKFQIRELRFHFWDWDGTGSGQSWMGGNYTGREVAGIECLGLEISQIFLGKIFFHGNGIPESRPLPSTQNLDLSPESRACPRAT